MAKRVYTDEQKKGKKVVTASYYQRHREEVEL